MVWSAADPGDQGFCFPALAAAVVDGRGTVVRWSAEAARLLGRPAGSVCGRSFRELLADPPAGPDIPLGGRVRLRCGPGGHQPREHHDSVDVGLRTVPLDGDGDGDGSGERLVLFAPAGQTEEWGYGVAILRAVLRQNKIGMTVRGTDLSLALTNITPEMFGNRAVPPGRRMAEAMSPQAAERIEELLREVLRTGEPLLDHRQPLRTLPPPGHEWTLSLSAFRLENAAGEPTGVAIAVDDVTRPERLTRHRTLLHDAADRIGTSLSVEHTARAVAEVVVGGLADLATVDIARPVLDGDEPAVVLGGGETQLVRVAGTTAAGEWPDGLLRVGETYPVLPDSAPLRRLQRGHSVVLDRAQVTAALEDEARVKLLVPEAAQALLISPLFARGLLLGTVAAWRTRHPDPFDESEVELLAEIASRAALGIDNARRYTREHRAAVTLQERLLPRATTSASAAETAGVYRPSGGGAGVSGDWFDVISLPSLRVAFVVGDVIGHGLAAAAAMGRLRTAVQSFANLELDPGEVLAHVEDLIQRLAAETPEGSRDTVGATCLYAVYDPTTCQCTLASAGNPPPVLVRPDGTARLLDISPDPMLGVGGAPFQSVTFDVEPASVLALYTDGLFQLEGYGGADGPERLRDQLAASHAPDRALEDMGRSLIRSTGGRPPRDDVALLLARTRAVKPENISSWQFPAELASVAQARTAAARKLTEWQLEDLVFTTELVVSELITNAVRYAGGPVSLRLIRDQVLICEVTDPSNTQPRLQKAATTDEGGRGLFIVAQCTSRWGCRYGRSGKTIWTELPLDGGVSGPAPAFVPE